MLRKKKNQKCIVFYDESIVCMWIILKLGLLVNWTKSYWYLQLQNGNKRNWKYCFAQETTINPLFRTIYETMMDLEGTEHGVSRLWQYIWCRYVIKKRTSERTNELNMSLLLCYEQLIRCCYCWKTKISMEHKNNTRLALAQIRQRTHSHTHNRSFKMLKKSGNMILFTFENLTSEEGSNDQNYKTWQLHCGSFFMAKQCF